MLAGRDGPASARAEATYQRIVTAARQLFAERGFRETSVRQIAERASVTDAALYYHFRSKRQILTALWRLPQPSVLASLASDGRMTYERLDELVDATLDGAALNDDIIRMLLTESVRGDQEAREARASMLGRLRERLSVHFRASLGADETRMLVESLMLLLLGLTYTSQSRFGASFAVEISRPAFRRRARELARACVPLERFVQPHEGAQAAGL
jgi:AcrR family transcriptional regulator